MTVGGRGAHYSVHSSGRHTSSIGIPGTGLSYVSTHKASSVNQPTVISHAPHQSDSPKPGLFASKGERLIYEALKANLDISLLDQAETIVQYSSTARLFKALNLATHEDRASAAGILEKLHNIGYRPEKDEIVQKYASASKLSIGLAPNSNLNLSLDYDDLTLFLSELYRQQNKFKEASDLLQDVASGLHKTLFICHLCCTAEKYEPILSLTNNLTNNSEEAMLFLIYRAIALSKTGHVDASLATFKEVLRYPSRSLDLRMLGWRERGKVYIGAGKKTLAKKDFERVFAENSEYSEISDLLALAS